MTIFKYGSKNLKVIMSKDAVSKLTTMLIEFSIKLLFIISLIISVKMPYGKTGLIEWFPYDSSANRLDS